MLDKYFNELQEEKAGFLKVVSSLDDEQYALKPKEGIWSVNQVMHHLVLAERGTLIYMNKKILGIDKLKVEKLKSAINYFKLVLFFNGAFRWKVPEAFIQPDPNISNLTLKSDWDNVRGELKTFIESHPDKDLSKNIFRHPLAGRMNMEHTLRFMRLHIQHHKKQLYRIGKAGNFSDKLN